MGSADATFGRRADEGDDAADLQTAWEVDGNKKVDKPNEARLRRGIDAK